MNKSALRAFTATFSLAAAIGAASPAHAEDAYIATSDVTPTTDTAFSIDTGYYFGPNTRIDAEFEFLSINKAQQFIYEAGSEILARIYVNGSYGLSWSCSQGGNWTATDGAKIAVGKRYKTRVDPYENVVTLDVDGVRTYTYSQAFPGTRPATCTKTLKIFNDAASGYGNGAMAKLFSFKIYESGELVRDYVPAKKGSTIGLYDRVNGGFITNFRPIGKDLAYGGDILEVADDPCIISDGTAKTGINSGCFWGPLSRIEVEYAFDALSPLQMRIFGADSKTPRVAFYLNSSANASFGFDTANPTNFSALSTAVAADTRRHVAIADQKAGKAYYVLKTETGVTTNKTLTIPSTPVATAIRPIALFGNNSSDPAGFKSTFAGNDNSAKARIYRAKFYENDVLVRDLVPLVKAGIPGFRDEVSGAFVTVDQDSMLSAFSASATTPAEQDDAYILVSDYNLTTTNYTTYIDTGYTATTETGVELDFAYDSDYPQSGWIGNHDWNFFGARNGTADPRFAVYFNKSGLGYCYGASLWLSAESPNLNRLNGDQNVRRTLVFDGHTKTLAFVTAGYTNSTATLPTVDAVTFSTSLKLGGHESGNSRPPLRVYGFKIFEGGVLQHDYVPRIKDGVAGLYDKIGGGFLTGADKSISLKYGGTIAGVSAKDEAAYIESDGTQAFNTGYHMNNKARIEVDFAYTDISGSGTRNVMFGAWGCSNNKSAGFINGSNRFVMRHDETSVNKDFGAPDKVRHTAIIDAVAQKMFYVTDAVTNSQNTGYTNSTQAQWPMGILAGVGNAAGTTFSYPAKARLYSFRIYENNALAHEYLPYKNGSTVGLYDTVAKEFLTDGKGGNAFVLGGMGVDGAEKWVKELPATAQVSDGKSVILTAAAAGAIRYKWTLNGEDIPGATGETCTATWRQGHYNAPDAYTCTAIYDVFGVETEGTPVTCEITNLPNAFVITVK